MRVARITLVFALLALAPLWRTALLGEAPYEDDLTKFYHPQRALLFRRAQTGHVPSWNPYEFAGMPFLADLQTAAFYPPSILYYVLPPAYATPPYLFLHLIIAGVGAFLLLRRKLAHRHQEAESRRDRAALFGAITFAFGGYLIVQHIHLGPLAGAALLPWSFLAFDRYATTGGTRDAILAGVPIALQILAGHMQLVFYTCSFGGLYVLLVAYDAGPASDRLRRTTIRGAGIALSVAAACLLSAVQLFPAIELASLGTRAQAAVWEHSASFSLDPEAWPLLLIPDLLGRGEGKTFNGPNTYWEMTTYIGILPLLLALFAATARRKIVGLGPALRPAVWLLAVATLVTIGRWGGLHYLLFLIVPGYRLFRASSRAWVVASLALAWLASASYLLVCERLDGRSVLPTRSRLAYGLFGLGIVSAIAAPIALPFLPIDGAELWRRTVAVWRFGAVAVAASWLLSTALQGRLRSQSFERCAFGLLLLDLGLQWTPYIRTRPPRELTEPPALAERIRATVGAGRLFAFGERTPAVPSHSTVWLNAGTAWGYRDLRGNNPMAPALICDLLARETPQRDVAPPYNPYFAVAPPALLRFGVTAVLTPVDYMGPLPDGAARIADDGVFALYSVPPAPRARVVDAAGNDAGTATLTLDGDDEVGLRTCADGSARLVLFDAYYPGWSANVDDRPVDIERVLAFRSVPLAPGCHDVHFTYRERWLTAGAWVTAVSVVALVMCGVSPALRRISIV